MVFKLIRKLLVKVFPELSKLQNPAYNLESIMSYSRNVVLGKNVKLGSVYTIIDTQIGDGTYISQNSIITNSRIGKYNSIGPNLLCGWGIHPINGITTSPMFYSSKKQNGKTFSEFDKIEERKEIIIGHDVFIGANVTILDGVTIGDGAVIGAGAIVSKDIPAYAVAIGCPIKIVKYRFRDDQIQALLRIKWWNFPEEQLQNVERMFFDIDAFIKKYDH